MPQEDDIKNRDAEISKNVSTLMSQRGIKPHKHCGELMRIFKIGQTTAFRKLKGHFSWTVEQIERIAAEYATDPLTLLIGCKNDAVVAEYNAILMTDSPQMPCIARIGDELDTIGLPHLVAVKEDSGWYIYPNENAPTDATLFHVESIHIDMRQADKGRNKKPVIAVVDDDKKVVNALSIYLNRQGFTPMRYHTLANFQKEANKIDFDGYVLDWLVDDATIERDIVRIRATQKADIPIILLTGKLNSGRVKESDIASVVRRFNVTHFEKPVRLQILHAALSQALDKASTNTA